MSTNDVLGWINVIFDQFYIKQIIAVIIIIEGAMYLYHRFINKE